VAKFAPDPTIPDREIYNFAPEGHHVYKSLVYYDELRYRLMPYIYSLIGTACHNDHSSGTNTLDND